MKSVTSLLQTMHYLLLTKVILRSSICHKQPFRPRLILLKINQYENQEFKSKTALRSIRNYST